MRTKYFSILLVVLSIFFIFLSGAQADQDLTDKIRIIPAGISFDPKTGRTSFNFKLWNISGTTLSGPFKVVIDKMDNDDVSIKNPDGYDSSGKAYYLYNQEKLLRGKMSANKKWIFEHKCKRITVVEFKEHKLLEIIFQGKCSNLVTVYVSISAPGGNANLAPVANAGPDQTVYVGDTVTLDGSKSSDADGNSLTFRWALTSRPNGSAATLSNATAVNPTFAVDRPGTYVAQLIVNDGKIDSAPDTVAITANLRMVIVPNLVGSTQDAAVAMIKGARLTNGTITTANSATVPAGQVMSQDPIAGTSIPEGSPVNFVVSLGPVMVTVPNVVSMTQTAAQSTIAAAHLSVGTITTANHASIPTGSVISQSPVAGGSVPQGTSVSLVVSLGSVMVTVPNVVSMTQAAAQSAIVAAHLSVGTITTANDTSIPSGSVISQNPAAGGSVPQGTSVSLVISLGPAMVNVPNVLGMLQANAEVAVTSVGLKVGAISTKNSDTVAAGSVISQDPLSGSFVPQGSSVNLVISLGPFQAVIGPQGGTIEVTDPESPIKGTKLVVPEGALPDGVFVNISISYEDNLPGPVGAGVIQASKVIVLQKDYSNDFDIPVLITMPYWTAELEEGDIPGVFYWDSYYNKYRSLAVVSIDTENKTVTFVTTHFSNTFGLAIKGLARRLLGLGGDFPEDPLTSKDTGFRSNVDGFLHPNFGTYKGSFCHGMTHYAKWYFDEKKAIDGEGLYFKYGQPDGDALWLDDTNARELIGRLYSLPSQISKEIWRYYDYLLTDGMAGLLFITGLEIDGPQPLLLYLQKPGSVLIKGHTVLVYKWDQQTGKFFIYDSVFPGREEEEVTLDWSMSGNGLFSNYSKSDAYEPIIRFAFDGSSSFMKGFDFEGLYDEAEAGWSASIYNSIDISSPILDSQDTGTVNAPNVTVAGIVSGDVTEEPQYIIYSVNNNINLNGTKIDLNSDKSFSFTTPLVPGSNIIRIMSTIKPSDADPKTFRPQGYTGYKDLTVIYEPETPSDTWPPVVTAFELPVSSSSLVVMVTTFTAADDTEVTGYLLTETSTTPLSDASAGWSTTPPASYTFDSQGPKVLYAWAKDAAGNISAPLSASTTISVPEPPQVFTLSGTVTLGAVGLQGVMLTLGGSQSTTTDADGYYSFSNLAPGGYTLIPSLPGYTFQPPSKTLTINGDRSNEDFSATRLNNISGRIVYNGSGLQGATVNLVGIALQVTNADGSYAFADVPNGSYTLTFSLTGYNFSPPNVSFDLTAADLAVPDVVATQTPQIDLNRGLVAYYPFDGNANDASGNGNDGTVYGATLTADRFGKPNSAYSFNGMTNFIRIEASSTNSSFNEITIVSWVRPTGCAAGLGGIVTRWNQSAVYGNYYGFWYDCTQSQNSIQAGSHEYYMPSTAHYGPIGLNTWSLVTYVISPKLGNESLYINGKLESTKTASENIRTSDLPIIIGADIFTYQQNNYYRFFQGDIDDVRIYNRALSQEEVQALFDQGSTPPVDLQQGLVAYYPFDGNANDASGNGNDGILNGEPQFSSGVIGSGLLFDGVDDFIEIVPGVNFNDNHSVSLWVKTDKEFCSLNQAILLQKGEFCPDGNPNFVGNAVDIRLSGKYEGSGNMNGCNYVSGVAIEPPGNFDNDRIFFSSGQGLASGEVYHLVITFNNSNKSFTVYINGNYVVTTNYYERGSSTQPIGIDPSEFSGINQTQASFKIGAAENWCGNIHNFGNYFKGLIDEVRIYNRVLSESEIRKLYSQGVE